MRSVRDRYYTCAIISRYQRQFIQGIATTGIKIDGA